MSFYTSPHYLKNTKSKGIIIFFLLVTSFLFLSDPSVIPIIFQSISDAYLQVSTFVAATLFLFFTIEKILKIDASEYTFSTGDFDGQKVLKVNSCKVQRRKLARKNKEFN